MSYRTTQEKLNSYRQEIAGLRAKMRQLQADGTAEDVQDYALQTADGVVRLSQLFGDKRELVVIHNMGTGCPACTMWADGFSGLYPHLADRAAFVVSSPDAPDVQKAFAAKRGWRFPMVSHEGTSFAQDMGYRSKNGGWTPGISVFKRDKKAIVRVADTGFDSGDDFCTVWRIFDLLPEGSTGWRPKFNYGA